MLIHGGKIGLYLLEVVSVFLLMRELLYMRRRSPPDLLKQLIDMTKGQKGRVFQFYKDDELDAAFTFAGIMKNGSAWQYKFYRDLFFITTIMVLHIYFLFVQEYPVKGMLLTFLLYMVSLTGKSFAPGRLFLVMAGKEKQKQKSDEIIDLYMLLSNDYQAENNDHYQSVFAKLTEFSSFTKALRPDLDRLLFDFPVDGAKAFKDFGQRVGTKEAKTLADLLEKINESNPEMAVDLLDKNYDTFLDFRRQRRKQRLKINGYIGHTVVFLAIISVIYFVNVASNAYKNVLLDALN
ncbi:hypothetical protein BK120_21795 [Paenibacillus sp. FSL A5-0031]|uniref:hypothetical protein n=1 Tax=Paenibacillus sp. FSL A5-0031 TaxID=1920420 RepID=UPI00096CA2F1|nr:hypothetical protein [Paenibacillus sp. FSL A5-0031]OME79612.1 hypothetical protein BK120_21795 [Paenibacillus sp. FSL A5-0031]